MPIPKTFEGLQERNKSIAENNNGMNWYLSFKEPQNCIEIEQSTKQSDNINDK